MPIIIGNKKIDVKISNTPNDQKLSNAFIKNSHAFGFYYAIFYNPFKFKDLNPFDTSDTLEMICSIDAKAAFYSYLTRRGTAANDAAERNTSCLSLVAIHNDFLNSPLCVREKPQQDIKYQPKEPDLAEKVLRFSIASVEDLTPDVIPFLKQKEYSTIPFLTLAAAHFDAEGVRHIVVASDKVGDKVIIETNAFAKAFEPLLNIFPEKAPVIKSTLSVETAQPLTIFAQSNNNNVSTMESPSDTITPKHQ